MIIVHVIEFYGKAEKIAIIVLLIITIALMFYTTIREFHKASTEHSKLIEIKENASSAKDVIAYIDSMLSFAGYVVFGIIYLIFTCLFICLLLAIIRK